MCKKIELSLHVDQNLADISTALVHQLSYGQTIDFIAEVDAEAQDWDFTTELVEHMVWRLRDLRMDCPEEYKRVKKRLKVILDGGDPDEIVR